MLTHQRTAITLTLLLLVPGCAGTEGDEAAGQLSAALSSSTFANVVPLCPATTKWGAWDQTSLSTWNSDVRPVVEWIINRTGISSSTYSGHSPSIGRAADWRPHSREEGTQLANWFLANTRSGGTPLGIDYVIWQAQIFQISTGVKSMEDRGSFTQNHCDHVHISFVKSGSVHFDAAAATPWGDEPAPDSGPTGGEKPPPPSQDDGGSPASPASSDAGVTPPAPTSGTPSPPSLSPSSSDPPVLVGGCTFLPKDRTPATNALWLVLLLTLGAIFRRHRVSTRAR